MLPGCRTDRRRAGGAQADCRRAGAAHHRRAQPRRARQRGDCDRAGAWHRGRSAGAASRRGDVRREGRSIGLRCVCAGARSAQPRAPRVDGRFPPCHFARRAARGVPAEDQPEDARRFSASRRSCAGSTRSSASSLPDRFIPMAEQTGAVRPLTLVDARARRAAVPRVAAARLRSRSLR